ncbi:TonB family protein [Kiloniella sp. EL199]|uniref:TonB family protein n=1 Tax=Kiloniella sp. EL199 TaxID=2107581 RepID=UPI000EA133EC|nr:TonB family protein [Kiloniella sp. EL199]
MQGVTVIRWIISCTVAFALHLGILLWSGKILPPASTISSESASLESGNQRSVSLATANLKDTSPAPVEKNTPSKKPSVPDTKPELALVTYPDKQQSVIKTVQKTDTIPAESRALTELLPKAETPTKEKVTENKVPTVPQVVQEKAVIPPKPKPKPKAPLKVAALETSTKVKEKQHYDLEKNAKPENPKKQNVSPEATKVLSPTTSENIKPEKQQETAQQANITTVQSPQNKASNQSGFLKQAGQSTKGLNQKGSSNNQIASLTYNDLPLLTQPSFSRPPRPPEYPQRAKRKKLQGNVVLRAKIDRSGIVQEIRVWRSSGHRLLDKAAEKAMRQWRFTPARQGGITTASWVEFPINFSIR